MGNAYSTPSDQNRHIALSSRGDDDDTGWDSDTDNNDLVALLEENARLRALVVRLSDLVLKNVIDQK
jgi:hypothetical protein